MFLYLLIPALSTKLDDTRKHITLRDLFHTALLPILTQCFGGLPPSLKPKLLVAVRQIKSNTHYLRPHPPCTPNTYSVAAKGTIIGNNTRTHTSQDKCSEAFKDDADKHVSCDQRMRLTPLTRPLARILRCQDDVGGAAVKVMIISRVRLQQLFAVVT